MSANQTNKFVHKLSTMTAQVKLAIIAQGIAPAAPVHNNALDVTQVIKSWSTMSTRLNA